MSDDQIVIVGAARTPMGGFQGELGAVPSPQLGATAIKAALERAGIAWRRRDRSFDGQCIGGGPRPSAGPSGCSRCRFAAWHSINHNLKGLWLWHEVSDDGP